MESMKPSTILEEIKDSKIKVIIANTTIVIKMKNISTKRYGKTMLLVKNLFLVMELVGISPLSDIFA